MTGQEYQNAAHKFATYGGNPEYPFAGLAEEAGEVLGKRAKFIRKHDGKEPGDSMNLHEEFDDYIAFCKDLKKELGDVLWMVAEICTIYKLSIEDVMNSNIEKLADRQARGVIVGEGDNR